MADTPINYADLEALYNYANAQTGVCDHTKAEVTKDSGAYVFSCPDCGRFGVAAEDAARKLGWIE